MPLFEYECQDCGVRFERLQRKGQPPLKTCPECGAAVRRLIQSPGVIFKGSGFYVTDNRRSSVGSRRSETQKSNGGDGETTQAPKKTDDDD